MARKKSTGDAGPIAILALVVAMVLWKAISAALATISSAVSAGADLVSRYWPIGTLLLLAVTAPWWTLPIRKRRYFRSEEFRTRKASIDAVVREHNEVADYVAEIRRRGSFDLEAAHTGRHAHLATLTDTSVHNYKRDRNVATLDDPRVHNCSLQVVKKASMDPIGYLIKYFVGGVDEEKLARVETTNANVASLQQAIDNLRLREERLTSRIDPPGFIKRHYLTEFMEQTGVALSPIEVPHPVYRFEYVSAGGNSGLTSEVRLTGETLDSLVEEMHRQIKWRKSVAGQRALMTSKLRTEIKERDDYTCKICGVSVHQEPHLLIEVDHIFPVSRGGTTTRDNLRALCWKCNRTKSDKIA